MIPPPCSEPSRASTGGGRLERCFKCWRSAQTSGHSHPFRGHELRSSLYLALLVRRLNRAHAQDRAHQVSDLPVVLAYSLLRRDLQSISPRIPAKFTLGEVLVPFFGQFRKWGTSKLLLRSSKEVKITSRATTNGERSPEHAQLLRARAPQDTAEEQKVRTLANSRHAPGDWIMRALKLPSIRLMVVGRAGPPSGSASSLLGPAASR